MKQVLNNLYPITVWKNKNPITILLKDLIDPIVLLELDKVKKKVLTKDRDWVVTIDGEEGVGKSVLAMQIGKYLDPNFSLYNIVFTADEFIKIIKDPTTKPGTVIILDEAFNAANARASMSEVNRSLAGVATEMRQKNLFILIVLPSIFDLDRYFALWRCRALFHVYFTQNEERRYIIFPKDHKKYLYLNGKKTYDYSKPRSPYPPCVFDHIYTVDETEYRLKKANAFKIRSVSHQARKWLLQRNAYIKHTLLTLGLTQEEVGKIPAKYGVSPVERVTVGKIMTEILDESDAT